MAILYLVKRERQREREREKERDVALHEEGKYGVVAIFLLVTERDIIFVIQDFIALTLLRGGEKDEIYELFNKQLL